jgi:lipoyl(octanoyl) transferase
MNWLFLSSGTNSGAFNMETDLFLANNCEPGEAVLRLYRWEPYCISLGANQNEDIINYNETKKKNIDIVARPTGGRAILHAEEITYSVIYPIGTDTSARQLYSEINFALKKGLEKYNRKLKDIELEAEQPDFLNLYKENSGEICFAASAKSELKFNGKKLAGSAQRKFKNSILQHGSILCGSFHKRIIDYLNLDEEEKEKIKTEMDEKTIELQGILKNDINYELLSEALVIGFKEYFNISSMQLV